MAGCSIAEPGGPEPVTTDADQRKVSLDGEEWTPNLTVHGSKEWERVGSPCPLHTGEVLSFFCLNCLEACCTVCGMLYHYEHQKRSCSSVPCDGEFGHTGLFFPPEFSVEGVLKSLNEELQNVNIHGSDASNRIEQCFTSHKSALEVQKRMLIDHINAVKKARLKFIQEQQKQLHKTFEELTASMAYMKRYSNSKDDFSFLAAEKLMTRRVAELNEKCSRISLPRESDWNLDKICVVRDGQYVKVNRSRRPPPPPRPGVKSIHDPTFKATSVKLHFSIDQDMFSAFVKTCCHELGEKYWLRVQ